MQRCLNEWVNWLHTPPRVCNCDTHTPVYVLITKGCEGLSLQHQEPN